MSKLPEKKRALSRQQPHGHRWQPYIYDLVLLALAFASLLSACVITSRKKLFWTDEVFSWKLITDNSTIHMLAALNNAADGGMPPYYLLARGWSYIFGSDPLSLRLLSSAMICAALAALWCALRHWYNVRATAVGTLTAWCTSQLLLNQNAEARYYGLYLLSAAMVVWAYARAASDSYVSPRLLAASFVANAVLVLSHIFGIIYSGLALVSLVAGDITARRLRWRLYAAYATPWLLLVPWLGAISRNADIAVPHNCIPLPNLTGWAKSYQFDMPIPALLLVIIMACFEKRIAGKENPPERHTAERWSMTIIAAGFFFLAPVVFALLSYLRTPVFLCRYMLPSLIGAAILLTQLAGLSSLRGLRSRPLIAGWGVTLFTLLACPLWFAGNFPTQPRPHARVEALVPEAVPIVAEDMHDFLEMNYFTKRPDRPYHYILDWDSAIQKTGMLRATEDFKLMRNWREAGYWSANLQETSQFLHNHPQFVVLDNDGFFWFEQRIANNPAFRIECLGSSFGAYRMSKVIKVTRIADL